MARQHKLEKGETPVIKRNLRRLAHILAPIVVALPLFGEANLGHAVEPHKHQTACHPTPYQTILGKDDSGNDYLQQTDIPFWCAQGSTTRSTLDFEPPGDFFTNFTLGIGSQFNALSSDPDGCDLNSCGWVTLTVILHHDYYRDATPYDHKPTLDEVYAKLEELAEERQWFEDDNDPCGKTLGLTRHLAPLAEAFGLTAESVTSSAQWDFYAAIRRRLSQGQLAISLVGTCGHSKWCTPLQYGRATQWRQQLYDQTWFGNGHFVLVTGLSNTTDWSKGPDWRWVRAYDPFDDQTEYYPADAFYRWQGTYKKRLLFIYR